MAIQSMVLDPDAASYTDDQIIAKVNSASAQITRVGSVAAAARPLSDGEVSAVKIAGGAIKTKLNGEADGSKLTASELATAAALVSTQLAAGAAKASLDAMADTARGYVKTAPVTGQFKVISIERDATGKLKTDYDDVAV